MSEIPILPPEVISIILDFLSHRERLEVTTVCRQWHDLVFGAKFCQRTVLHVQPSENLRQLQNSLPLQRCRSARVRFRGTDEEGRALVKHFFRSSPVQELTVSGNSLEVQAALEGSLPAMGRLVSLVVGCGPDPICSRVVTIANSNLQCLTLRGVDKGMPNIEINCPAMTSITIFQNDEGGSINLPHTDKWSEIRSFSFGGKTQSIRNLAAVFEKMPNIRKLWLVNICIDSRQLITNLTELSLVETRTEFAALRKSIIEMKNLETLHLIGITFQEETLPSSSLASNSITEFVFRTRKTYTIIADFPNLESLSYIANDEIAPQVFEQICVSHPKLQRLSFGICNGFIGMFLTETSITNINKLPSLKVLHLVRMSLDNVAWSQCHRTDIQKIRLESCPIDGRGAQQLAAAFPRMSELFLDNCYLRQPAEAFEIAENYAEADGLRSRVPHCRVSYYDCHVEDLYDTCGGGGRAGAAGAARLPL